MTRVEFTAEDPQLCRPTPWRGPAAPTVEAEGGDDLQHSRWTAATPLDPLTTRAAELAWARARETEQALRDVAVIVTARSTRST
jgi:hypothetical protein